MMMMVIFLLIQSAGQITDLLYLVLLQQQQGKLFGHIPHALFIYMDFW